MLWIYFNADIAQYFYYYLLNEAVFIDVKLIGIYSKESQEQVLYFVVDISEFLGKMWILNVCFF